MWARKDCFIFCKWHVQQPSYGRCEPKKLRAVYEQDYPLQRFEKYEVAYNTNENALILDYFSEQRAHDQDLSSQIKNYKATLESGFKIITVAHSQGNFYTNFAFEQIKSPNVKMISVATPASYVFGNGPYFTFKSDGIIKYVSTALELNQTKPNPGFFDHRFIEDYLNDPIVHKNIMSSIQFYAAGDKYPQPSLNPEKAFFHSDVTPIINWFNQMLAEGQSLDPSECLLAHSIFGVYGRHRMRCTERNLKYIKDNVEGCRLDRERAGDVRGETMCPFYAGMESNHPFEIYYPSERFEFYKKFPQCDIRSVDKFVEAISHADILKTFAKIEEIVFKAKSK